MLLSTEVLGGLLGVAVAVIQMLLIRNPVKNIVVTGFVASVVGGYHVYLQPSLGLPAIPEAGIIWFGAYVISKGILSGLRFFGVLPF